MLLYIFCIKWKEIVYLNLLMGSFDIDRFLVIFMESYEEVRELLSFDKKRKVKRNTTCII